MPISDLLASITGEKPNPPTASSASTAAKTSTGPVKRKADDDLNGSAQKTHRTAPLTNGSVKPGVAASAPTRPGDRPSYAGSAALKAPNSQSISTKASSASMNRKAIVTPSKSSPASNGIRSGGLNSPSVNRPATTASAKPSPAGGSSSKAQPKKGSYAEIMARANAAQATRGVVGKIQHKAMDKVPTKREREELKAEQVRALRKGVKPQSAKPGHARAGLNGSAAARDREATRHGERNSSHSNGTSANGRGTKAVEEEKKLKKSAVATTGYTGTARPPPGASRPGSSSKPAAPNGARDRHHEPRPYGAFSARRSRDNDYDEELDDFIEYDDDEPEYGGGQRGYGGYSDEEDESDMEAGLSDIDVEERRAEVYARNEDRREEALEKKLKREKEERKRMLLGGGRQRA